MRNTYELFVPVRITIYLLQTAQTVILNPNTGNYTHHLSKMKVVCIIMYVRLMTICITKKRIGSIIKAKI